MGPREFLVSQIVDKVCAETTRMYAEISRIAGFDGPSERGEMFKNISEGRDEIEGGFLNRVVLLGYRWEEVVDRGPDERDQKIQGVDLYWVWTGKTKACRGFHFERNDDWLRHWVVGRGGEEERGREENRVRIRPPFINPLQNRQTKCMQRSLGNHTSRRSGRSSMHLQANTKTRASRAHSAQDCRHLPM